MKRCVRCVLPSTKPDLKFNEIGECNACENFIARSETDWENRRREFLDYVKTYSRGAWDCIVPVSGGKDSTYQVITLMKLGLRPLAVTSTTCDLTPIGRRNLLNLRNLGVDHIEVSPNPKVRRYLNRIGLEEVGDISWPEHVGIFTIPVRVAIAMDTPLIIWGENSQNEYGGPATAAQSPHLTRRWLEEFGGLLGLRVSDLPENLPGQIEERDLSLYTYPSDEELAKAGVSGLFLGHFFPWDGFSNALVAQASGFETYGHSVEGSVVDYENLDNYQTGIHDYFKFLKFGFGRATDIASLHVRRGRISRNQAMDMVKAHDGKYPSSYLGKSLHEILEPLDMTQEEFDVICDRFTNRSLFEKEADGSLRRDRAGNLSLVESVQGKE